MSCTVVSYDATHLLCGVQYCRTLSRYACAMRCRSRYAFLCDVRYKHTPSRNAFLCDVRY
eukprot:1209020-Rhodomonas_salina.3